MTKQIIEDGELFGIHRGKLNSNFTELYDIKLESAQVLTKTNTNPYTPTQDYHPATKIYADSLRTNWDAIFNPQNISADVFERENHTGQQSPGTIQQDSDNRFVTDSDKANWNQKEDSIGTKGTAFNKDFGTTSGTVATGNHIHTKSDIGLGNVDNTSDVDKPVSDATQVALDAKADASSVDGKLDDTVAQFVPQTDPGAGEGQVFYDSYSHSLSVKNDQNMTLNLGSEFVARVLNNTGADIQNSVALYATGSSGGLPTVGLAQADSFATSDVVGISTHIILAGQEGFITTFGHLGGDFSSLTVGDRLYLSSTVAGGFVTVAPDIATKVGAVIDNTASGAMAVRISSNMALPTIIGALNTGSAGASIDGTYASITGYSPVYSVGVPVNGTTGEMTVPTVGLYRLNINLNIRFSDTGNSTAIVDLQLWNVTLGAEALVISSSLPKNSEGCALSPTFVHDFTTPDEVFILRVRSTGTTLTTVTYQLVTFDLESVHLRE